MGILLEYPTTLNLIPFLTIILISSPNPKPKPNH